jgi:toxin ParE1/3/4
MKRRSVELDAIAVDDLQRLAEYITRAHGMPRTARRYVQAIRDRCLLLRDVAILGRDLKHIEAGLRSIAFKGTVIVFKVENGTVRIRRIFRHEQDIERLLGRAR